MHITAINAGIAPGAKPLESYHLPAEKLVAGNPRQSLWPAYQCADGKFFTGVWASEVGTWRIDYTEQEYCEILEGESVLRHEDGTELRVRAGDRFVIPRGFRGTWQVVTPTRKVYVIYEPGTSP